MTNYNYYRPRDNYCHVRLIVIQRTPFKMAGQMKSTITDDSQSVAFRAIVRPRPP